MCLWPTTLRQETQRPHTRCWPPPSQPSSSKLPISTPAINCSRFAFSSVSVAQVSCSTSTEQQMEYLSIKMDPHVLQTESEFLSSLLEPLLKKTSLNMQLLVPYFPCLQVLSLWLLESYIPLRHSGCLRWILFILLFLPYGATFV